MFWLRRFFRPFGFWVARRRMHRCMHRRMRRRMMRRW